ncbi:threonine-phosphate decarboxylase [Candidatus Bathyarchaeota archaeon A05DMB-2]|jgi:threonine-phosphate decarboxylase|nr:threonine-phosphate decarboxylase [Candidatus Bathyarchaeota archaeon A05DMB-2]
MKILKKLDLKPCVHGGEVWEISKKTGLRREDIIDFSSSVNPLGPSQKALEAIKDSLSQIPVYPDSNSTLLRKAIASRYEGVTEDNVVVGNGSTELIYLFAEAFLEDGDVAVVPAPTFGEYERAVRRMGKAVNHVYLNEDFHVEVDAFLHEMAGAKVLFFCNPNNPASLLTPKDDLIAIVERALEQGVLVFLDEDFLEFVEGEKHLSLIGKIAEYPNLFVLRSFTKIYGLTGLRVGYGIASKEIIQTLTNAKTPWNVNCLAQVAAIAALDDEEHLEKTRELVRNEKAFLMDGLRRIAAFKVYPADANFIFMDVRKSGFTAAQLKSKLLNFGLLIRDCSSFHGLDEYYVRVAVKTRRENERLLEAFKKTVEDYA